MEAFSTITENRKDTPERDRKGTPDIIDVCIYLKVRAGGGQHIAMTGELLSLTTHNHITQAVVATQPVEAL